MSTQSNFVDDESALIMSTTNVAADLLVSDAGVADAGTLNRLGIVIDHTMSDSDVKESDSDFEESENSHSVSIAVSDDGEEEASNAVDAPVQEVMLGGVDTADSAAAVAVAAAVYDHVMEADSDSDDDDEDDGDASDDDDDGDFDIRTFNVEDAINSMPTKALKREKTFSIARMFGIKILEDADRIRDEIPDNIYRRMVIFAELLKLQPIDYAAGGRPEESDHCLKYLCIKLYQLGGNIQAKTLQALVNGVFLDRLPQTTMNNRFRALGEVVIAHHQHGAALQESLGTHNVAYKYVRPAVRIFCEKLARFDAA